MGNFLVKPVFIGGADGDGEDFYVLYGTRHWMPEAWGSREELEAMPAHAFSRLLTGQPFSMVSR